MRQGQQPAKLNASLRHNVGTLSTEIEQLEVALDGPQCASLTKQEKSRRRDLLSVLRMRRNQVKRNLTTVEAPGTVSPPHKRIVRRLLHYSVRWINVQSANMRQSPPRD